MLEHMTISPSELHCVFHLKKLLVENIIISSDWEHASSRMPHFSASSFWVAIGFARDELIIALLVTILQANNCYIFPGLALGCLLSGAIRIHDEMILRAGARLLLIFTLLMTSLQTFQSECSSSICMPNSVIGLRSPIQIWISNNNNWNKGVGDEARRIWVGIY